MGWSGGVEGLSFDECLFSYGEIWSWGSFCIGRALILDLGFRKIVDLSSWCSSSRLTTRSLACDKARSLLGGQ